MVVGSANRFRVSSMPRRFALRAAAVSLLAAWIMLESGAASAAIAPWYPRDVEDRCRVVAGAEPGIETVPPPWQVQVLRGHGWVGQDPRVYTVPPVLDCRGETAHRKSSWACAPTFLPWAKRNCRGLEIRE